ncbi:unnamed protein product [Trichobilharzia regenti]|nr:unnamed protein product [Trichobilharzia regenti]
MRLRHVIMIWYYPEISDLRASWLRAHIKNNREAFHGLKHISRVPIGNPSDEKKFKENFYQCPECSAYFCRSCQLDLEHICSVCRTPLFARDAQIDFEEYSTDEEYIAMHSMYLRRAEQNLGQLASGSIVINPLGSKYR